MCTGVPPSCMSVFPAGVWCPQGTEEGIRFPKTGVTGDCNHHVGPLKEQSVLLTFKPSFKSLTYFLFKLHLGHKL